jgi:hypothetical protein
MLSKAATASRSVRSAIARAGSDRLIPQAIALLLFVHRFPSVAVFLVSYFEKLAW